MTNVLSLAADMLDPPVKEGETRWRDIARPDQLAPLGDWFLWLILSGRGWGKTMTGAHWLLEQMLRYPSSRWGLVCQSYDDGRDIMVEGESGLIAACDMMGVSYTWKPTLGHFIIANGSRADLISAEKPESARGPNLRGFWGDEPASWRKGRKLWDALIFAIRKGDIRICLTGTPKNTKFMKFLKKRADHVTVGKTQDNLENLSPKYVKEVIDPVRGTRLERQELNGELLEDVEGALWTQQSIDDQRLEIPTQRWFANNQWNEGPDFSRIVVSIDPSASAYDADVDSDEPDEAGIVVAGLGPNEHAWITEDLSGILSPKEWATRAIEAYNRLDADCIVAEKNNGGEMVRTVIHAIDPTVKVKLVWASKGKYTRAEPVAAFYDKKEIHHSAGVSFDILEGQMTGWVQGDPDSPDRMDALVWAITELKIEGKAKRRLRNRERAA